MVTRRALLEANSQGDGSTRLAALRREPEAVTHGDQPLRHVAEMTARHEVSRMLVMDREDPTKVTGVVSLTQLLAGRQRDQQEARERERVLRVRLVAPAWARR